MAPRFTVVLAGACAVLALPALALRRETPDELRARLARTEQALAGVQSLGARVAAGDASAVAELLAATEPAPADPAHAEVRLLELRTRVGALQEIVDARAVWAAEQERPATVAAVHHEPADSPARPTEVAAAPGATAPAAHDASSAAPAPHASATPKTAFEAADFVADRALLGRACWRAGRWQEGLAVLEPLAGDPRADYWRARCLERLARSAEAIALYQRVVQAAGDTPEGRSAREDCEFLEWKLAHGLARP